MPKRATKVVLSEKEQEALVQITKRHRSEQQQAQRARMILAAAQGTSNAQIARELHLNVDTVRLWRDRWVGFVSLHDLRDQILAFITYYNRTMAKPIKWTYT